MEGVDGRIFSAPGVGGFKVKGVRFRTRAQFGEVMYLARGRCSVSTSMTPKVATCREL